MRNELCTNPVNESDEVSGHRQSQTAVKQRAGDNIFGFHCKGKMFDGMSIFRIRRHFEEFGLYPIGAHGCNLDPSWKEFPSESP